MRKLGGVIVALLTASVLLAACGDSSPASSTGANQGSRPGSLTIWLDSARSKALSPLVKKFSQQNNIEVRLQELAFNDIRDQLKIAGPAGEGPDIIVGANDWVGELINSGLIEPFDLGDKEKSFDPVALRGFTYDKRIYGVPYSTEAVALMYNKDLVPEPPKTWDELKQIARKLQDEGKVAQGYTLQQGDPYHTYPIYTGFGGYVFGMSQDGTYNAKDLGLDKPGSQAAVQELNDMLKAGLLQPGIDIEAMQDRFRKKQTAMIITGPWSIKDARASGVNFGIAPIPQMKEKARPFVGVQGFMLSSFSKNKLLAKTFMTDFIATSETMKAFYDADPRYPSWTPIQDSIDADIKAFGPSIKNGDPIPSLPQMSAVWNSWQKGLILIFQQQVTPERAMKDAADAIRKQIN